MITTLIILTITQLFLAIFNFIPDVSLTDIPIMGDTIVSLLYSLVETWNAFLITFPYAEVAWNVLLYWIIPFELGLMVLKFFLGSRMPNSD